ncbi:MAG: hypothetical protein Q9225_007812, partial [Loekoesia sp. 1 TL-2023]
STLEGGSGAIIDCIPKELNDWQGAYWSSWLAEARKRGFKSGDQFRVRIKFFNLNSVQRRDLNKRASPVLSTENKVTIISSSAFGNLSDGRNDVIVPLTSDSESGYLGKYTVDYSITGGALLSASIMDDSGDPIKVLANLPDGKSNKTSFNIEDEGSGNVWLLGWTKSEKPQVRYSVQAPPAPNTSRSVSTWIPSATGSTPASTAGQANNAGTMGVNWYISAIGGMMALL